MAGSSESYSRKIRAMVQHHDREEETSRMVRRGPLPIAGHASGEFHQAGGRWAAAISGSGPRARAFGARFGQWKDRADVSGMIVPLVLDEATIAPLPVEETMPNYSLNYARSGSDKPPASTYPLPVRPRRSNLLPY